MRLGTPVILTLAVLALPALGAAQQPLRTAVDGTFAPHAMPRLEGGIQGFNVDLANEIGKRLKRPVEIAATQFSGILPSLQAGSIDFVGAPVTVTKERAENYIFTEGYLNTDYQFVTKKGEPAITDLKQLKGKVISVNKGSAYDSWARGLEGEIGWTVESFGTQTDAVQAVIAGRAYANVAGNTVVQWAVKQQPQLQLSYLHVDRVGLGGAAAQGRDRAARPDRERHRVHEEGRHHGRHARALVRHEARAGLAGRDHLSRYRRAGHARLRQKPHARQSAAEPGGRCAHGVGRQE